MRPYQIPSPKQFKALGDFLISKGFTAQQISAAIGSAPQGRPIGQIADELRANLLKNLPRGTQG